MVIDELLAELDTLGVTLGHDDGRPSLRVPGWVSGSARKALMVRVSGHRDAVLAHLKARTEPLPPESWECVVCGREVDAATIPLLAGPHYCANAGGGKTVTGADGNKRVPLPACPFKGVR